jgi:hypothetical protein
MMKDGRKMFVSFPVAFSHNSLSYWQDDDNLIFLLQEEKWEILNPCCLHMDGTLTLATYQKNNKRFKESLCCKFGLSGVRLISITISNVIISRTYFKIII